jgi:hypothetical protein
MPQPGDVDMDGYMILYLDKRMIPFNYYSGTIARERAHTHSPIIIAFLIQAFSLRRVRVK